MKRKRKKTNSKRTDKGLKYRFRLFTITFYNKAINNSLKLERKTQQSKIASRGIYFFSLLSTCYFFKAIKDMLGREELCSLYDAREALLKLSAGSCFPKEIETDIDNSINRILSSDIVSSEDLPGFSRSTMDGFAVNIKKLFLLTFMTPQIMEFIQINVTRFQVDRKCFEAHSEFLSESLSVQAPSKAQHLQPPENLSV